MHPPPSFPSDYYRASPVRGQLEPYDPASPRHWRYLQTTDTPNELKVLLPPAISSQYDQLLKLELAELAKRPAVQWERILEIRHLKDRMIRKCQRLSRILPPKRIGRGDPFVFQSLVAPEDFRLKEMEAWFQQEARLAKSAPQPPVVKKAAPKVIARNSACVRCREPPPPIAPSRQPAASKPGPSKRLPADHLRVQQRSPSPEPTHRSELPEPPLRSPSPIVSPASPELVVQPEAPEETPPTPVPLPETSPPPQLEQNESGSSSDSSTVAPTPPPSPPPLPHLLRISDHSLLKDILDTEVDTIPTVRPTLARRRSCIKRSSGDSGKTVSWADDHAISDQISKIAFFTSEPREDESDNEDDPMSRIDSLHLELKRSLEEVQADPSHFELVESLITEHKEKMRSGVHDAFHFKGATLLEKVLEVDEEASSGLFDSEDEQDI